MRSKGKLPTEMALLARKNVFTLVSQAELGFSLMQQKYGFVWTECTPTSSALSLWIYPTDWAIEGVSWKKWRVFLQGFNKQTNIECKTKCKKMNGMFQTDLYQLMFVE